MSISRLVLLVFVFFSKIHFAHAIRCSQAFSNPALTEIGLASGISKTQQSYANLDKVLLKLKTNPNDFESLTAGFKLAVDSGKSNSRWDDHVEVATLYIQARAARNELSIRDLEGYYRLLIHRSRGAERALLVAERLYKENPDNPEYQNFLAKALVRSDRIDRAIEFTNQRIKEDPSNVRWYIYQIQARIKLENNGLNLPSKYHKNNKQDFFELLKWARQISDSDFLIASNYLRLKIELTSGSQLNHNLRALLVEIDLARSLATNKKNSAKIEEIAAKLYLKVGQPQMALFHADEATSLGGNKNRIGRLVAQIKISLHGDSAGYQHSGTIHSRVEQQPRYHQDAPDWVTERNSDGFENGHRNWYEQD